MGAKIVSNNGKKTLPGVHVPHHKNTNDCVPQVMPVPDKVYISLHMHMGAPCDPLVKKGDTVLGIAKSNKTTVENLAKSNKTIRDLTLPVGTVVLIDKAK